MSVFDSYKVITNPHYRESELIANKVREILNQFMEEKEDSNLLIVIGGDGTFLYSQIDDYDGKYYLGIKAKENSYGFYCVLTLRELDKLYHLRENNFEICELKRLTTPYGNALNEVQIHPRRIDRMLRVNLEIKLKNGKSIESIEMGSGLVIYTPTGANAFAKNLDGALGIDSIGLVGIAPHSGILREHKSVTIPTNLVGSLKVYGNEPFLVSIDSQRIIETSDLSISLGKPLKYVLLPSKEIKGNVSYFCKHF